MPATCYTQKGVIFVSCSDCGGSTKRGGSKSKLHPTIVVFLYTAILVCPCRNVGGVAVLTLLRRHKFSPRSQDLLPRVLIVLYELCTGESMKD